MYFANVSLQNAQMCTVRCNTQLNITTCQLFNCILIYDCVDNNNNLVYQRNKSAITLFYGQNYYLTTNGTEIIANHFVNNEYCFEYSSRNRKSSI